MWSRPVSVIVFGLLPILSASVEAGELRIERVFGPEVPTGPYKHPACMTELSNGDLYLVYYGGKGEYAVDTAVFGSRLKKGTLAMDAAHTHRARPVPVGRQRGHLGGPRRHRLAVLRGPLWGDLVDVAHPVQGLARPGRDLVRRLGPLPG